MQQPAYWASGMLAARASSWARDARHCAEHGHAATVAAQKRRWQRALGAVVIAATVLLVGDANAQSLCDAGAPQLIIYHAGSLSAAFTAVEKVFSEETGVCVVDIAGGSLDAARQVTTGGQPCDIFASADDGDIDLLFKPDHYADYTIKFAQGGMVLAYTTASKNAATITAREAQFEPPERVPDVASDWYLQLIQPGVVVGGSHPFLDPGGYRADMIFQLAQQRYGIPNLYNKLLAHYAIGKPGDALGKTYDYQFTYEHSALAAFKADASRSYRYARLPSEVSLASPALQSVYAKIGTTVPGLRLATTVRIPATRVTWGLTILHGALHRDNALHFLEILFSRQGVAIQSETGPTPISPPTVSRTDYARLPAPLKPLVVVYAPPY